MSQPTKKDRAAAARQRAEQMRLEAEAKSRRTKRIIIGVTTAVVAALVVLVLVFVQNARQAQIEATKGPDGLTDRGGLVVGDDSAKVTVTQFTDFMCPACHQYELANGDGLQKLKQEGKIRIEYVPVAILDEFSSGTRFSTRSASAAFCVMESNPDKYETFLNAMYDKQPPENSEGLTDEEIASIAAGAGVSEAGQTCIKSDKYEGFSGKVTSRADKEDGLAGTPYILVNDKPLDRQTGQSVFDAIKKAGVDLNGAGPLTNQQLAEKMAGAGAGTVPEGTPEGAAPETATP